MTPYVIVLAASATEASQYARRADLPRGRWRFATSANAIKGLRAAALHVLPSYAKRVDRHAIESELRWGKHERFNVEMPARTDGATEQGDLFADEPTSYDGFGAPMYVVEEVTPPVAMATVHKILQARRPIPDRVEQMQALSDAIDDDPVAPIKKAKRRSRCKVCDALVLGPDDPAHDDERHDASQVTDRPDPASMFS